MFLHDDAITEQLIKTLQNSERGRLTITFLSDEDNETYKITCVNCPFEIFAAFAKFIEHSSENEE